MTKAQEQMPHDRLVPLDLLQPSLMHTFLSSAECGIQRSAVCGVEHRILPASGLGEADKTQHVHLFAA